MKKWIDHIAKRVFTVSGFVTSAIILLIIGFLFTEAVGLFNNPIVEDGYTLVVNKENPIKSLSSQQIKDLFDEEIVNWKELEAAIFPYKHSVSKICQNITPKKNSARNTNMPAKKLEI